MKKPKLAWHQDSPGRWSVTFGQSKLHASVRRINDGVVKNSWVVAEVLGRTAHNDAGVFVHAEGAMIAAEKLAVKYIRQLLNYWVAR